MTTGQREGWRHGLWWKPAELPLWSCPHVPFGCVVISRPEVEGDPASWWATHDRGTGKRPRPGTRVWLRDGRAGTVTTYEGCWKSCVFPVLIDGTGQSLMLSTSDIAESVISTHPRERNERGA